MHTNVHTTPHRTAPHRTELHRTCSGLRLRGPFPWVSICLASLSKAALLRYLPASTLDAIMSTETAPAFRGRFLAAPPPDEAPTSAPEVSLPVVDGKITGTHCEDNESN